MRKALLLVASAVALFAFAASTPTAPPPVEELALGGFPAVSVEELALGAQPRTRPIVHVSPERFENFVLGTCSLYTGIDFGDLARPVNGLVPPCRESAALTVPGAVVGDTCLASTTYGADDGGTVPPAELRVTCRVTVANQATIQVCYDSNDGGSIDLGAGLFRACVLH